MAEMILLRKELNAIDVTLTRQCTVDHPPQMQVWLEQFEQNKQVWFAKTDEIKSKINSISDVWLQ